MKRTALDITLAVPGLPFNGEDFERLSIGGSESAGYYMARALARQGHRVTCFTSGKRASCGDVDYVPIDMFRPYLEYTTHDVCIAQRMPELFSAPHNARFSALWCHDLGLLRKETTLKGVAWNFDKIFVLSKFMRDQYKEVYALPDEIMVQTRNGIDLEAVEAARFGLVQDLAARGTLNAEIERDPFQLVYAARPERGLDILLSEIMPRVLQLEPRAHLVVCSYHNPVDHLREFYEHCNRMAGQLGDRVNSAGNLSKIQLYQLMLQSGLYVYPTPSKLAPDFDEVSCIALMEAQACGLPVVSTARGALPETLDPAAGTLIDADVHTNTYYEQFARAVVRLMHQRAAWKVASNAGLARAADLSWDGVAKQWTEIFEQGIRENNSSKARLLNHFWRRSDIMVARELMKQLPEDDVASEYARKRIKEDWAFLDEEDGFRKQYERIGDTHDKAVINWSPREPRYQALGSWLQQRKEEVTTVLDYGCAHGGYATNLLKALPHLKINGVDIDRRGIQIAGEFAQQLGVTDRWVGTVGDFDVLRDLRNPFVPRIAEDDGTLGEAPYRFDCAIAQEVLEHVPTPWETLKALENKVKDGGLVYITVPFGPWEYTDYMRGDKGYPHRAHIWEFDLHDLHEMLDVKGADAQVSIFAMPAWHSPCTQEPLGWWVITYRVTPESRGRVNQIDMQRKMWLQRPRQTVSLNMMAGPGSRKQLLWCLDSVVDVVDEVVIVDNGLEAKDLQVLKLSDVADRIKLVPGVDPTTEGFETSRNIGLKHCTQDWVLWLDTDEQLLQPEYVHKYLRSNVFNGYSIRQHHFAVDTRFDADLPVRLFRNNGKCRWYGMIHEHPETGLNEGPGLTIVLADVHIPHTGYLIESGRKRRFARNLPMLEADKQKYPARILQKHFIMRDNMLLNQYDYQQNGGQVTETMKERCREVIELHRKYFAGKGHYSNVNPHSYYSQALAMLGEGFDFYLNVAADKVQAKPNGGMQGRFATVDEAVAEATRQIKEAAQPLEHRYY